MAETPDAPDNVRPSVADTLDAVPWDHEPDDPSPLEPTHRYFAGFPWDGDADDA